MKIRYNAFSQKQTENIMSYDKKEESKELNEDEVTPLTGGDGPSRPKKET